MFAGCMKALDSNGEGDDGMSGIGQFDARIRRARVSTEQPLNDSAGMTVAAGGSRGETDAAKKATLSAVIVTCDDAEVIEPCLRSIAGWVDEIVVVDMHSADGTREIVQRYTNRLLDHERLTNADPMRNYALAQTGGTWTLLLDADERVPAPLAAELRRIADEDAVDVVMVPFVTVMFGKALESPAGADAPHPRLFRKGAYWFEAAVHTGPDLTGKSVLNLKERGPDYAIHHNTWRNVTQVVDKLMRYAPLEVEKLQSQGVRFTPGRMLYEVLGAFIGRNAFGHIYEDGVSGELVALYFAFYRLAIHSLLWEAQGSPHTDDRRVRRWGKRWRVLGRFIYWTLSRQR